MRLLGPLLMATLVLPVHASAQAEASRASVGAVLGRGGTWDDEGSLGKGFVTGGRVEWRLFGRTGVEGAIDFLTHERSGGAFESEGTSAIAGISLVHRLGTALQMYVLEGVDLVRHSGTTSFEGVPTRRRSTDVGFHGGVGFSLRVSDRLELGPEARFYVIRTTSTSNPAWAYWIGGRIGTIRLGWRRSAACAPVVLAQPLRRTDGRRSSATCRPQAWRATR